MTLGLTTGLTFGLTTRSGPTARGGTARDRAEWSTSDLLEGQVRRHVHKGWRTLCASILSCARHVHHEDFVNCASEPTTRKRCFVDAGS